MFNGNAVGDHNRTRFRFDFVDQALTFAAGSSQSSSTGAPHIFLTGLVLHVFVIFPLQAHLRGGKLGAKHRITALSTLTVMWPRLLCLPEAYLRFECATVSSRFTLFDFRFSAKQWE
jgi:hypothetical protein